MGPLRQNPIQRTVRSVQCSYVCAVHCVQLLNTILHRTDLIIFPFALQTITTAPMMSIWGKGGMRSLAFSSVRAPRGLSLPGRRLTVLCPATFWTVYWHHALCNFSQEIRLSTSSLCTASNTNFLSKSCPRRLIWCWLLTNTAVPSAVTNFRCYKLIAKVSKLKNSGMDNFICHQYGERFAILNTENIKICVWITKLEATKNAICLFFFNICRKFEVLISQGSVATCLKWGEYCHPCL